MTNPASLSLDDLARAFYLAAYAGTIPNEPGSVVAGSGIKTTPGSGGGGSVTIAGPLSAAGNVQIDNAQTGNKYQSITASGSATAPTAGATIATLAITFAGYYKIQAVVGFAGTAETTAVDNFHIKNDTTDLGAIPAQNTANWTSQTFEYYQNVAASKNITVVANAAASAGAIYKATIIATRVGG